MITTIKFIQYPHKGPFSNYNSNSLMIWERIYTRRLNNFIFVIIDYLMKPNFLYWVKVFVVFFIHTILEIIVWLLTKGPNVFRIDMLVSTLINQSIDNYWENMEWRNALFVLKKFKTRLSSAVFVVSFLTKLKLVSQTNQKWNGTFPHG